MIDFAIQNSEFKIQDYQLMIFRLIVKTQLINPHFMKPNFYICLNKKYSWIKLTV